MKFGYVSKEQTTASCWKIKFVIKADEIGYVTVKHAGFPRFLFYRGFFKNEKVSGTSFKATFFCRIY